MCKNNTDLVEKINIGLAAVKDEGLIEEILEETRYGPDGEPNTGDEGILPEDFEAMGLDMSRFTTQPEYVKVTVEGVVGDLVSTISAVFRVGSEKPAPLFWLEGAQEKDALPY